MPQNYELERLLQSIRSSLSESLQKQLAETLRGRSVEMLDFHDLFRLTDFLRKAGKQAEMLNVARFAQQVNPSSLDLELLLAGHFINTENSSIAGKQLSKVIQKLTESLAQAQYYLGVLLIRRGQYQNAYELFNELHGKFPNNPSIVLQFAFACGMSLRIQEAVTLLHRFINRLSATSKERAAGLYQFAAAMFARNEFEPALKHIQEAVQLHPERELYSAFLATVQREKEKPKDNASQALYPPLSSAENTLDFGHASVDESGVYDKRVPPECRDKKTGMKICFIASVDTAGQFSLLERSMNRYSPHRVRSIFYTHNSLYPIDGERVDICFNNIEPKEGDPVLDEALAIIREADFFHVYEGCFSLPGFDFLSTLNSKNCVWQYCGSSIRNNPKESSEYHRRTGIEFIFNWDSTCIKDLHRCFYHIQPYIIDFDTLPEPSAPDRPVRICHSPTNRLAKGTDYFLDAMTELSKKFDTEAVVVEKVMNDECLKIKSTCHILYDQLTQIGLNAIEGLAMGLPSIGMISSYMRIIQYDTPVVSATPETLKSVLQRLIEDNELRATISKKSREWVMRNFSPQRRVRDYGLLYDYIKYGDRPFEQFAEGWDEEILQWGYEDIGFIYSKK